jgi:hypothetical protein
MFKVSRKGSEAALQVFLKHYYNLSWIREFVLKCKFKFLLKSEDDSDNPIFDEMVNDLYFLIRSSIEFYPTSRIMWLLTNILDDLKELNIRSFHEDVKEVYFYASIMSQTSAAEPAMSKLWLQVAMIPLRNQKDYNMYAVAKLEEAKSLGYPTKTWKSVLMNADWEDDKAGETVDKGLKEHILMKYLEMEWKNSYQGEALKTKTDWIQYLHSLTKIAENEKDESLHKIHKEVVDSWNLVISLELQDVSDHQPFIRAYCGTMAIATRSLKSPIWMLWDRLHRIDFPSGYSQSDCIQLFNFLENLTLVWEKITLEFDVLQQKITQLPLNQSKTISSLTEEMLNQISKAIQLLCSSGNIRTLNTELDKITKKDLSGFLREVINGHLLLEKKMHVIIRNSQDEFPSFTLSFLKECEDYRSNFMKAYQDFQEMDPINLRENLFVKEKAHLLKLKFTDPDTVFYDLYSSYPKLQNESRSTDCDTVLSLKIIATTIIEKWMYLRTPKACKPHFPDNAAEKRFSGYYTDSLAEMYSVLNQKLPSDIEELLIVRCHAWLRFSLIHKNEEQSKSLLEELSWCRNCVPQTEIPTAVEIWDSSLNLAKRVTEYPERP